MFYKKLAIFVLSIAILFVSAHQCFRPKKFGTVVILNGSPCVGKSTTIKAIQAKQNQLWLGMGIDNFFVGVLPTGFFTENKSGYNTHAVMQGIATEDEEGKLFSLYLGEQGNKIIKGMHRAIAAYARSGNNILVDYTPYNASSREDFEEALAGIPVIKVGMMASLPILLQREKLRGTSPEGLVRSQYEIAHQGWNYDLEIDTDYITADQAADLIIEKINKN